MLIPPLGMIHPLCAVVRGAGKVIHSGLSKLEPGEAWLQGARLALET